MKNYLSGCPPVILHNPNSFGVHCIFNRTSNSFGYLEEVSCFFFRNLKDILIVPFGNHKRVSLVDWAIAQKSHHLLILVNDGSRCFFADYLAEDTVFGQGVIPFMVYWLDIALIEFLQ